ncbi:TetR/AcrR family transcriptional regulator [Lichenicoccus sp.]|uniref:TetR/AcrR family transcriptional regulator n=1 Tax=Lichenicoccus sp. TaxID=2781899 RepID=UPI003D10081B
MVCLVKRPYHHGDLPAALLLAAGDILRTEGLQALTLRAVARRVGVSHMAPTPHFGDLSGLLSELAAVGYRMFNDALRQAQNNPGARSIPNATARAYVAFARAEPAMFVLMFRSERLNFGRPALAEAAAEASRALMFSAGPADTHPSDAGRLAIVGRAVGQWSVVHGFAMLLIDGRLDGVLAVPECHGDVDALLDMALAS